MNDSNITSKLNNFVANNNLLQYFNDKLNEFRLPAQEVGMLVTFEKCSDGLVFLDQETVLALYNIKICTGFSLPDDVNNIDIKNILNTYYVDLSNSINIEATYVSYVFNIDIKDSSYDDWR